MQVELEYTICMQVVSTCALMAFDEVVGDDCWGLQALGSDCVRDLVGMAQSLLVV